MWILGIDTSTKTGSVALLNYNKETKEEKLISEFILNVDTTHSSRLMPAVNEIMRFSGISVNEINGISVTIGPGSFTGIRIGITTAMGIANSLQVPLVGIPTFEVLSYNLIGVKKCICTLLKSRQDIVYSAVYRSGADKTEELMPSKAIKISELTKYFNDEYPDEEVFFIGEGVSGFREFIISEMEKKALFLPAVYNNIRAGILASIAKEKLIKNEFSMKDNNLTPLYCSKYQINCADKTYMI